MQRQQRPNQLADDVLKMKREIEDLLVSYTSEMKEENERLIKQIQESKRSISNEDQRGEKKNSVVLQVEANSTSRKNENHYVEKDPYENYLPPIINSEEEEDVYEQSDTAKVLSLSKKGLTTEEIAKKLNLGKGEVDLMLKFYR
jgi:ElaB/YqjD/DUF883 family membrane-anchored ribosome-binding protein